MTPRPPNPQRRISGPDERTIDLDKFYKKLDRYVNDEFAFSDGEKKDTIEELALLVVSCCASHSSSPAAAPVPWCYPGCMLVEKAAEQAAAKERKRVLDALDIELEEIKSRIESSAMGKPLSERERGRIIGVLDARVKIESLRQSEPQERGSP